MEDYTSNSKKSRDPSAKKEPEKKVVTGEVIQKPVGVGRKFKHIFLGGDAKHAAQYVASDVLLPALRNLIVEIVTRGSEKLIYGESRRGPTNYSGYGGSRYSVGGPTNPWSRPEPSRLPPPPRGRQNRHDMNDVIISTREEADLVMERMIDILDKYQVVSLADLYELLGLPTSHIDNKWGWTYLGGAQVSQIRQGYLLQLPPLEEI